MSKNEKKINDDQGNQQEPTSEEGKELQPASNPVTNTKEAAPESRENEAAPESRENDAALRNSLDTLTETLAGKTKSIAPSFVVNKGKVTTNAQGLKQRVDILSNGSTITTMLHADATDEAVK